MNPQLKEYLERYVDTDHEKYVFISHYRVKILICRLLEKHTIRRLINAHYASGFEIVEIINPDNIGEKYKHALIKLSVDKEYTSDYLGYPSDKVFTGDIIDKYVLCWKYNDFISRNY